MKKTRHKVHHQKDSNTVRDYWQLAALLLYAATFCILLVVSIRSA